MSTKQELNRIKEITGCKSFKELMESLDDLKYFMERDFGYKLDEEYTLIDFIFSTLESVKYNKI